MNQTPERLVAIGIYDNKGTLRRKVDIREDGTFEPFKVEANEMVYSVLDLGDGSKPSLAPWQTSHRPPLIVNRWAAFTDDELDSLESVDPTLADEMDAERDRREPRAEGKPPREGVCAECWGWTFHRDGCSQDGGLPRPESRMPA